MILPKASLCFGNCSLLTSCSTSFNSVDWNTGDRSPRHIAQLFAPSTLDHSRSITAVKRMSDESTATAEEIPVIALLIFFQSCITTRRTLWCRHRQTIRRCRTILCIIRGKKRVSYWLKTLSHERSMSLRACHSEVSFYHLKKRRIDCLPMPSNRNYSWFGNDDVKSKWKMGKELKIRRGLTELQSTWTHCR